MNGFAAMPSSVRPRAAAVALAAALSACVSTGAVAASRPLVSSWRAYVHGYVQSDGRVIDHSADMITTSEGQAYALVRAWWSNDRTTFDRVRTWTVNNLQAGDPAALPAWKWGARADGSWGVIDANPAADADLWIAWALLGAAKDWDMPEYRLQAVSLSAHIWDQETADVAGSRTLLPGPWAQGKSPVPYNPSYAMPFVFRTLAAADPAHDWSALVTSSYAQLGAVMARYPLPPDWCWLDATTGALTDAPTGEEAKQGFAYDAMRVPWILSADLAWSGSPDARALLPRFDGLLDRFHRDGVLPATFALDGTSPAWESRGLYGALLPYMATKNPSDVPKALARIDDLRDDGHVRRAQGREYYAENWAWFGQALLAGVARPVESP